ncbi:MAG: glycosyltransferase family 2 protein [Candidatus Micrarchaeia archaeon]
MSKKVYVSIVIPTLNEEGGIGQTIEGIKKIMKGYSYEIMVVDSSTDKTPQIAKSHGARVLRYKGGKGAALIYGFENAKGEIIISMDADLSNRPKELKLLIAGIEAGYDMCTGSRFLVGGGSEDMPLIRKLGNKFFVSLVNLLFGSHYSDMCYGYRSFTHQALKKLKLQEKGFGIETEMNIKAQKARLRVLEVPSFEKRRKGGAGKLKTFRDGYVILSTILRNI